MKRNVVWLLFFGVLALTLGLKAVQLGWFAPRPPPELDGQPVLLFFNKARGCECELLIYHNANSQMDNWRAPVRVINIDLDQRPDLAQTYGVIRAPTLILLDSAGEIVWRQDVGVSDEAPLDLDSAEAHLDKLFEESLP